MSSGMVFAPNKQEDRQITNSPKNSDINEMLVEKVARIIQSDYPQIPIQKIREIARNAIENPEEVVRNAEKKIGMEA